MSESPLSDSPFDLSSLDPSADAARFDCIVGAIAARAEGELARRRARPMLLTELARWTRPVMAAAAVIVIVSLAAVARASSASQRPATASRLAEAIGVPSALASIVYSGEIPPPNELLFGLREAQ